MTREELMRRVKKITSKGGDVVAVLDLAGYAAIPSQCPRETIEKVASTTVVNASSIEKELAEARAGGKASVSLVLVHQDPTSGEAYVIKAGYVAYADTPVCFRISSLPQKQEPAPGSGSDTPVQIPIPRSLPHRTKLDMKTERAGQHQFSRLAKMIYVLSDLLNPHSGILPSGDDWWEWARADLGDVSSDEDEFVLYLLLLGTCRDQNRRDFVKAMFGDMLQRCADADPTFLPRLKRRFPAYGLCLNAAMLRGMVSQEIDAVAEMYRAEFFTPQSPFAYSLPKFVTNCINIIHSIYVVPEE